MSKVSYSPVMTDENHKVTVRGSTPKSLLKFSEEFGPLKDKSACAGLRANLKMCLLDTDCCKKKKMTPANCLRTKDPSVPVECYQFQQAFFECKRSTLDNRARFRGRKGD